MALFCLFGILFTIFIGLMGVVSEVCSSSFLYFESTYSLLVVCAYPIAVIRLRAAVVIGTGITSLGKRSFVLRVLVVGGTAFFSLLLRIIFLLVSSFDKSFDTSPVEAFAFYVLLEALPTLVIMYSLGSSIRSVNFENSEEQGIVEMALNPFHGSGHSGSSSADRFG